MRTQSGVGAQRDDHVRTTEKATIYQPRRDQTYRQLSLRLLVSRRLHATCVSHVVMEALAEEYMLKGRCISHFSCSVMSNSL